MQFRSLIQSLLTIVSSSVLVAQHQRLAIPAGEFDLQPASALSAEGYCLDKHLWAPTTRTPYPELLTPSANAYVERNGVASPLIRAIQDGWVRVTANHLNLTFENATKDRLRVVLREPAAFGEKPGAVEPGVLAPLREAPGRSTPIERKKIGGLVWEQGKYFRSLRTLDLLADDYTTARGSEAVRRFQESAGLQQTGTLGPRTRAALDHRIDAEQASLVELGFPQEFLSGYGDISESINSYKRLIRLPENGRLDSALRARMETDRQLLSSMNLIQAAEVTFPGQLARDANPSVITFHKGEDSPSVWMNTPSGPELWQKDRLGLSRNSGSEALKTWNASLAIDDALVSSRNILAVRVPVHEKAKPPRLYLGGAPIEFPGKSLDEFLAGKMILPELQKRLELLKGNGSENTAIIVLRDPLLQGLGGEEGHKAVLAAVGGELPDSLLVSKAFGRIDGPPVYVANDLRLALANLGAMPKLEGTSSLAVWIDDKLVDKGTVSNLRSILEDAQIEVVETHLAKPGDRPVVMFAGRNTPDFRAKVMRLAAEGKFKGGVLALAVCGEGGEAEFNSAIIRSSGARAVIFYDQKINVTAVQEVMVRFAELLQHPEPGEDFRSVWIRSINLVLADPHTPEMESNIRRLVDVMIQLARAVRIKPEIDAL